jgi:hypothetical protein
MDRERRSRRHLHHQAAMTHTGRLRTLAAVTLAVAVASTTACNPIRGAAHKLEPGLGANYAVTNHTNKTLTVQERAQGPHESLKPYNPVTDGQYTIPAGQTVYLTDVFLAANQCAGYTLLAYDGKKEIAHQPAPLCVNAKAVGGWTIPTP